MSTHRAIPSRRADVVHGILKGSDKGLLLEKTLTRAEAAVLLVRVMGADAEL